MRSFNFRNVKAELDEIANRVERLPVKNASRLASRIDLVTNSLPDEVRRTKKSAGLNDELVFHGAGENEGEVDATHAEDGRPFKADGMGHKVPVGNKSLSQMMNRGLGDMSHNLNFADEGVVQVQASKRKPKRKPRKADYGLDVQKQGGDSLDTFSTAGLPESGHDDAIDDDEEGGVLEFWGNEPEGTLHGPEHGEEHFGIEEESHESSVNDGMGDQPPLTEMEKARSARRILERAAGLKPKKQARKPRKAADVRIKDPQMLDRDGKGDDVERDQDLGGMGGGGLDHGMGFEEDFGVEDHESDMMGDLGGMGGDHFLFDDISEEPVEDEQLMEALGGHSTADHFGGGGFEEDDLGGNLMEDNGDLDEYNDDQDFEDEGEHMGGEFPDEDEHEEGELPSDEEEEVEAFHKKKASRQVKIKRLAHVPREMMPVWMTAARRLASSGRLIANGRVDYRAINAVYSRILGDVQKHAVRAAAPKQSPQPARKRQASKKVSKNSPKRRAR